MELGWPLPAKSLCLCVACALPQAGLADVVDDSHLSLNIKNLYLNRNFTQDNAPVSKVGNWSQGFDLQFESGYTDTPLALGFDLDGQYAVRLDSTGNDGSLPFSRHSQQTSEEYSRGGATLKLKYAKSVVKIGDQRPFYPVASNDPSRQLDTIYQGAVIESRDIDKLTLVGGRFWSIVTRESSNHERLYRFGTPDSQDSDGLDFAGATYAVTPDLQGSYFHGVLNDIYKQDYAGIKHTLRFADGYQLKTDVGYFNNQEDGAARSGPVDNRAYFGLVSVEKSGHTVGVVYQRMTGDTVFPTLNGFVPQLWLPNWGSIPFIRPDERSWSLRYGYNFAALGIPGLKLFTRYTKGTDVDRGRGLDRDEESERDIMFSYVVQSGPLKDLAFDLKNMHTTQKYGSDYDEYRFITSYTWKFW
ncbi:outer membrane porin, OprD family [Pseudomonas sp. GM84]|uniref:OprD family outer membrane porin n=1 Tax=Pseudomonas sp. GM84 TaxID=1144340 RepID=UPI00026FCF52|nr:OprD family outer membrane porin [Pseudomonas sp. GM84]EJN40239.1 outer membrane porin, OprD family [Pseudomonas sp. GM84]